MIDFEEATEVVGDGDGQVHWLMSYRRDGTATYVGLQRVKGAVGERRGSLVIDASGELD